MRIAYGQSLIPARVQIDNMDGGSISVSNANGTFASTQMIFTEQYKRSISTFEWEANVTITLNKDISGQAAETITGFATFFPQGGATGKIACNELVFRSSKSGSFDQALWIRGPNPPPTPAPAPGPGPAPRPPHTPQCEGIYNKSACDSAKTCEWCLSTDQHHALCFASKSATKLDSKKWSCDSSAPHSNEEGGVVTVS